MAPRRYAIALAGALLLAALSAACTRAGITSPAGTTTLCSTESTAVAGGAYTVQNNEWGSSAPECITTGGNAGFRVAKSSLANPANGAPGGYPSIYKGCHWGACTSGSGLPLQVARIRPGTVTTSWSTSQPGGSSVYNVAYDIWFNRAPATTGHPDGAELMIWLNHHGPVHPTGFEAASNFLAGGHSYDVWLGRRGGWKAISYSMTSGATSVSNLDLQPLIADAVSRGVIRDSWYLIGVEAGFELWQGGTGLTARSFSVTVTGG